MSEIAKHWIDGEGTASEIKRCWLTSPYASLAPYRRTDPGGGAR
jgi:hypothetical protein